MNDDEDKPVVSTIDSDITLKLIEGNVIQIMNEVVSLRYSLINLNEQFLFLRGLVKEYLRHDNH